MERSTAHRVVVIGAGPAGLTAALKLTAAGVPVTVLEASDAIGGISRTVERDGWRFDLGGHRFFTKAPEVEQLWHEILRDDEFLERPRMSRILYGGKLFDYPLKPMNALVGLGPIEAIRCLASYVHAKIRPPRDQSNFEGWVAARFGYRLYRIFFKTYTEKVWGIPATSIQADWAAQRIKDLSLPRAVANALFPRRSGTTITTLIDRFQYPKLGPGMMWERARDLVEAAGGEVVTDALVTGVHRDGRSGDVVAVTACVRGQEVVYPCTDVISSMPLPDLVRTITPSAPASVIQAADDLRHRDFLTVALVVPQDAAFPDNWIYVHTPGVRVGRVQNFGSWSPYMVKEGWTCVGLEYFVNEGDDVWTMRDDDLIELARTELVTLGLLRHPDGSTLEMHDIGAGYVERVPKAYPVYDDGYQRNVDVLRGWLDRAATGIQAVGRNGMHRYNNQDHSMLTAMLAVRNVLGEDHDLWAVNLDEDYHEGGSGAGGRAAPVMPRVEEEREPAEVGAA